MEWEATENRKGKGIEAKSWEGKRGEGKEKGREG